MCRFIGEVFQKYLQIQWFGQSIIFFAYPQYCNIESQLRILKKNLTFNSNSSKALIQMHHHLDLLFIKKNQ